MGQIADAFVNAFRAFVTDGVPASGAYKPEKVIVQALGGLIDQSLAAIGLSSVSITKDTATDLAADLAHDDGTTALVYADATGANNDIWLKSGTSGSGSWANTGIIHSAIQTAGQPFSDLAKAWAQSDTAPDPDDPDSKSAKTFALEAAASAAALSAVRTHKRWYRGKLLASAVIDGNRRMASCRTVDGTEIVFKRIVPPAVQAQVDARTNALITTSLAQKPPIVTAFDALAMAAYGPVELIPCVLDSNGLKGGYGWIMAWQKALTARFGIFSTGVACTLNNGGGNPSVWGGGTQGTATTGADDTLTGFAQPRYPGGFGNVIAGNSYGYTPDGSTFTFGGTGGLQLKVSTGVNPELRWRVHYAYGTFASGPGSFNYQVRLLASPFTIIAASGSISTNTGSETYKIGTLDIPADPTRTAVGLQGSFALSGSPITGPMIDYFHRFECLDRSAGITVHAPLFSVGSQSAWDGAQFLQTLTDAELTNYLTEVRRLPLLRGLKPRLVFLIDMGLNDQNETQVPSRGWKALDPTLAQAAAAASSGAIASAWTAQAATQLASSAQAYMDNTLAIMKRIEEVYQANHWPDDEVYWLIIPSHVAANEVAGTSMLPAYRAAAFEIAARKARCSVVDMAKLVPQSVISGLWQDSTGFHLENPYEANGDGTTPTTNGYDVVVQNYLMPLIPTI